MSVRRSRLRLYRIVDEGWGEEIFAAAPLGDYQFATVFFFQSHGTIESDNRALRLLVRWRLRCDALQPQAGSGHQRKERTAMLGGEADDFIRDAGYYRQQNDARREARPERREGNQHVKADRDQHYGHQKAGAAAGMEGRVLLHCGGIERIAVLEGEYSFVLGAVILVDPSDVREQRNSPDE